MAISDMSGSDEMMRLIVALVKLSGGVAEISWSSLHQFEPGDGVLVEENGDKVTLRLVTKKSKVLWLGKKSERPVESEVHVAESPATEKPWIVTDEVLAAAEASFREKP